MPVSACCFPSTSGARNACLYDCCRLGFSLAGALPKWSCVSCYSRGHRECFWAPGLVTFNGATCAWKLEVVLQRHFVGGGLTKMRKFVSIHLSVSEL